MGLLSSERGDLSKIWGWTIVLALAFAVMSEADQTIPSTQPPPAPVVQEEHTPEALPTVEGEETADHTAVDVEIQRRFNDLRRELLDDRAGIINWWLNIILVVLGFFSVIAVFGGYFGFRRFREIEAEAKNYAEEARKGVEEINEQKKLAEEARQETESIMRTAAGGGVERRYHFDPEDSERDDDPLLVQLGRVQREPDRAREAAEAVQEVRRNPEASLMDRAIAEAYSLQQAGRMDDAIEKWRSIANVAEGNDPDLAARAWLSVGYLLYERGVEDAGEE